MSDRSFRNSTKNRREHRERAQPAHRASLGPLEKKKDYKIRAKRTHLKEGILKNLREKAAMKNPDEFYFGMANAKRLDGQHVKIEKPKHLSKQELVEMKSQDISYITMKKQAESAKVKKLGDNLHFIGASKGKHTIFVDNEDEAEEFSATEYFNTPEPFLGRTWNRPTHEALESESAFVESFNTKDISRMEAKRARAYQRLSRRMMREKELTRAANTLTLKKNLMTAKGSVTKKMKANGETSHVWKKVRKG